MLVTILILFSIGSVGLLFATALPALAAQAFSDMQPNSPRLISREPSLGILVTAHNEQETIAVTLNSLVNALRNGGPTDTRIVVGLDHCTDSTESIVDAFIAAQAQAITIQPKRGKIGKWQMIVELVHAACTDWVALVDSGSIWDPKLLISALPLMCNLEVDGIAPSYMPFEAGALERLQWRLEQWVKHLESKSGGPISVHGATVFYRRTTLLEALACLESQCWLNDDLVIPSVIRLLNPLHRIVYLQARGMKGAMVVDCGLKSDVPTEIRRRRRIAHGSAEWLHLMCSLRFWQSPGIAMLVSRRVSRMMWPYWVTCLAGALLLAGWHTVGTAKVLIGAIAGIGLVVITINNYTLRLSMAYLSGLRTPYYLWRAMRATSGNRPAQSW